MGQKLTMLASVMGGEILGLAVFRFCFALFFANGVVEFYFVFPGESIYLGWVFLSLLG